MGRSAPHVMFQRPGFGDLLSCLRGPGAEDGRHVGGMLGTWQRSTTLGVKSLCRCSKSSLTMRCCPCFGLQHQCVLGGPDNMGTAWSATALMPPEPILLHSQLNVERLSDHLPILTSLSCTEKAMALLGKQLARTFEIEAVGLGS